jgi:hypothetical protein
MWLLQLGRLLPGSANKSGGSMIYLAVMATLLFVPSAVFYAAFHLAHRIQTTYQTWTKQIGTLLIEGS